MKKSKKWEHERDILEAQREKALPEIKRLVSELCKECPGTSGHFFNGLKFRIERYGDLQHLRWDYLPSFIHRFNYRYSGSERARGLANTLIVLLQQLKALEERVSSEYKKTQGESR